MTVTFPTFQHVFNVVYTQVQKLEGMFWNP